MSQAHSLLEVATARDCYATFLVRLDKTTGRAEKILPVEGTSFHATRFGDVRAITTVVEPSEVNDSRDAGLYLSSDGEGWSRAASYRKDPFSFRLFQFGTLVLPVSAFDAPKGMISGQAVSGFDDRVRVVDFDPSAGSRKVAQLP